jgi:hypothetical protein
MDSAIGIIHLGHFLVGYHLLDVARAAVRLADLR